MGFVAAGLTANVAPHAVNARQKEYAEKLATVIRELEARNKKATADKVQEVLEAIVDGNYVVAVIMAEMLGLKEKHIDELRDVFDVKRTS